MIRLEILSITDGNISVAMYYPVPNGMYSPSSNDQTRIPRGIRLNTYELQDFRDGKLYEYIDSIPVDGKSVQEIRADLQRLWGERKRDAAARYKQEFSFSGLMWDGSSWS